MDIQFLFNVVYGVAMFGMGFILDGFRRDIKSLADTQQFFERHAVETFARKDVMNEAVNRIETMLTRIEDKLDRKVDRAYV